MTSRIAADRILRHVKLREILRQIEVEEAMIDFHAKKLAELANSGAAIFSADFEQKGGEIK